MKTTAIAIIVAGMALSLVLPNPVHAEVWGVKTHDPLSQPPSTLFRFPGDGSGFTPLAVVTLNSSNIEVDGLAMSAQGVLYGFQLTGGGSTLITINTDTSIGAATVVGVALTGREIRGAVFTADGTLLALDATKEDIIEVNPATGAVNSVLFPLTISGQPYDVSNVSDIVQTPIGDIMISDSNIYYLVDLTTGTLCEYYRDTAPTQGGAVVGVAGLAFTSAHPNTLFAYDVNHDDDIYAYLIGDSIVRNNIHPNIISSYNAGRGDLTAVPISIIPTIIGDIDYNGQVDLVDLSALAHNWLQEACGPGQADFNTDGFVDLDDLARMSANWPI